MPTTEPERILYLAIEEEAFVNDFSDALKTLLIERLDINILIFGSEKEEIIQWLT